MTRPKGYAEWNPKPETRMWLTYVRQVLDQYRSYGAMTARQIFYRLVAEYDYDKTEKAYSNLANYLVRARRAGYIDFGRIRDDGTVQQGYSGWSSRDSFWNSVRATAESFELNHRLNQPYAVELWCEAAGMAPMLADFVADYHIPVYSTGGFSSVTVTWQVADRARRSKRPLVFLHAGDYDPSGESIFESMAEDIGAFVSGMTGNPYNSGGEVGRVEHKFYPKRIALTPEQVAEYDLPTAPPKASDSRSANWYGETTQLEAMAPPLLREVVRQQVEQWVDQENLAGILDQERADREEIMRVLAQTEEG